MPQLELSDDAAEALAEVLEIKLRDLSYEIADTDTRDFRNQLKSRRDLLQKILDDLKSHMT